MVVEDRKKSGLHARVKEHVEAGAALYSDALQSYDGLAQDYAHQVIDHAEKYVDGQVHTNGLENFWSLLKRGITGTYVSVEPFHLFRYLDEQVFRYNNRATKEAQRDRCRPLQHGRSQDLRQAADLRRAHRQDCAITTAF